MANLALALAPDIDFEIHPNEDQWLIWLRTLSIPKRQ
jgi:hypothetical protein